MSGLVAPELGRNCSFSGPNYSTKNTTSSGLVALSLVPPVMNLTKAITAPRPGTSICVLFPRKKNEFDPFWECLNRRER